MRASAFLSLAAFEKPQLFTAEMESWMLVPGHIPAIDVLDDLDNQKCGLNLPSTSAVTIAEHGSR